MTYSISDLEQLTGVQAHTIRIWERRYQALKPMRSSGNTRYYDDTQLKRLFNLASLNKTGFKISKIGALSDENLNDLLDKNCGPVLQESAYDADISRLLDRGLSYDEAAFNQLLDRSIANYGLKDCYSSVMYPVLVRLGLMWRIDHICPAQEHFISNLIRRKIFSAIDALPLPVQNSSWLLFLPEDEDHDIGLLFAYYLLRSAGQQVIFLGSKVPVGSVQQTIKQTTIGNMLFFLVQKKKDSQNYLQNLSAVSGNIPIYLASNPQALQELELYTNMHPIDSLSSFENMIQNSLTL